MGQSRHLLNRRSFEKGLVLSALIHLSLVGAYRAVGNRDAPPEAAEPRGPRFQFRGVTVFPYPGRTIPLATRPVQNVPNPPTNGVIVPVTWMDPSSITLAGIPGPVAGRLAPDTDTVNGPGAPGPLPEPPTARFGVVDVQPVPLEAPRPRYPDWAQDASIQGTVVLHVLVGKDGRVKQVVVVRGVLGLDDEAAKAVRRWVFRPALSNGNQVEVWVEVPVAFRL